MNEISTKFKVQSFICTDWEGMAYMYNHNQSYNTIRKSLSRLNQVINHPFHQPLVCGHQQRATGGLLISPWQGQLGHSIRKCFFPSKCVHLATSDIFSGGLKQAFIVNKTTAHWKLVYFADKKSTIGFFALYPVIVVWLMMLTNKLVFIGNAPPPCKCPLIKAALRWHGRPVA